MSADLPTAMILPPATTIAASRMTRRLASMVISQGMSAMTRSTDCTGSPDGFAFFPLPDFGEDQGGVCLIKRRALEKTPPLPEVGQGEGLLALPDIGEFIRDLELDEHV